MTVKELIEKLKKFNPDGDAEVWTHYYESEQGYNDAIDFLSMEENSDGKLILVIHTNDNYQTESLDENN